MNTKTFVPITFLKAMETINNGMIDYVYFKTGDDYMSVKYCPVNLYETHKRDWYLRTNKFHWEG